MEEEEQKTTSFKKNIDERLRLAKIWYYETESFLKSIIWSDETKIILCESDGIAYCKRKTGTRHD